MPTNNFPGIGYTTAGLDFNYYKEFTITTTTFGGDSVDGYQPTGVIWFNTYGLIFTLLSTGGGATAVQYSFNGQTVHGTLTTLPTQNQQLYFENRVVSKIWFKVLTGTATVSVQAWAIR